MLQVTSSNKSKKAHDENGCIRGIKCSTKFCLKVRANSSLKIWIFVLSAAPYKIRKWYPKLDRVRGWGVISALLDLQWWNFEWWHGRSEQKLQIFFSKVFAVWWPKIVFLTLHRRCCCFCVPSGHLQLFMWINSVRKVRITARLFIYSKIYFLKRFHCIQWCLWNRPQQRWTWLSLSFQLCE